jgi:photosystem II stability/assembly factor-like uncharacterized protein
MAKTQTRPARRKTQGTGKRPARRQPPPPWYRRQRLAAVVVGVAALVIVVIALRSAGTDVPALGVAASKPVVGADLHSLVVDSTDPDTLYIGSHQGVSVSTDGGQTWEVVETLNAADAMGWAFTDDLILVGGHPGLSVSTDGGATFKLRNEGLPSSDVHALGAGKNVIYAGLAGMGTFASTDGGQTWEMRSQQVGGAFMGRIQVDPTDNEHILAPDMSGGAMESTDGGRTWEALGGGPGAMWASWDSRDTDHIIASGQGSAAVSTDGGQSWEPLEIPEGASLVEFSPHDSEVLFAAVLEVPEATVYVSKDGGSTWTRP